MVSNCVYQVSQGQADRRERWCPTLLKLLVMHRMWRNIEKKRTKTSVGDVHLYSVTCSLRLDFMSQRSDTVL